MKSELTLNYIPLTNADCQQILLTTSRFISYLQDVGFYKEREIAFPHKQAALMKLVREAWDAPAL